MEGLMSKAARVIIFETQEEGSNYDENAALQRSLGSIQASLCWRNFFVTNRLNTDLRCHLEGRSTPVQSLICWYVLWNHVLAAPCLSRRSYLCQMFST